MNYNLKYSMPTTNLRMGETIMKALVCEMCGSHDIIKRDGYYVCQSCETKYTPEEARKLFVEGTVKIDNSDRLNNLYSAARKARELRNYAQSKSYYSEILTLEPNSWEAAFYSVYCVVADCKIIQIESAANTLRNAVTKTFQIIETYAENKEQAKLEVAQSAIALASMLHDAALSHLNKSINNYPQSYNTKWLSEYWDQAHAASFVCFTTGNLIKDVSSSLAVEAWKRGIIYNNNFYLILDYGTTRDQLHSIILEYEVKIKRYEPGYSVPLPDYSIYASPIHVVLRKMSSKINYYGRENENKSGKYASGETSSSGGGCYVATAVYGSYDCPQVWTLRRFRDYELAKTWYGRAFIRTYYAISPTIVKWFGNTTWFKKMWKGTLDRMVSSLNNKGVADTPYEDRKW